MSTFLFALVVVVVAGYAAWYINKLYSTPLKSTFVKKVEPVVQPVVEVKKNEPVGEVKKVRKPRAKKNISKKKKEL
jgi:hypothetical protein